MRQHSPDWANCAWVAASCGRLRAAPDASEDVDRVTQAGRYDWSAYLTPTMRADDHRGKIPQLWNPRSRTRDRPWYNNFERESLNGEGGCVLLRD